MSKKGQTDASKSLAARAYDELEERIVTLQLSPGAVVSEQQLASELGVGRSPVREALQRLAFEGLIVVLPRRGILISEINVGKHNQLLELRREVERLMVRAACRNASEAQCKEYLELSKKFKQLARQNEVQEFMRVDARFNELLSYSVDNEFVFRAMQLVRGLSRRFWFMYYKLADVKECARLHGTLAQEISRRNPDKAVVEFEMLMDYMFEFTASTLVSH